MRKFEIYFSDLTEGIQEELCEEFQTSPEEESWETIPLAAIEREEEEDCNQRREHKENEKKESENLA